MNGFIFKIWIWRQKPDLGGFTRIPTPTRSLKMSDFETKLFNVWQISGTRDRCYDFLNIFAEKFGEKIGVFDSKQS
jgi:hypothetical protein